MWLSSSNRRSSNTVNSCAFLKLTPWFSPPRGMLTSTSLSPRKCKQTQRKRALRQSSIHIPLSTSTYSPGSSGRVRGGGGIAGPTPLDTVDLGKLLEECVLFFFFLVEPTGLWVHVLRGVIVGWEWGVSSLRSARMCLFSTFAFAIIFG